MRKFTTMLSTLLFAAILLTACGGEETSTSVPETDLTPMTEDTPTTEFTPTTEEPAGTATVTSTDGGTPEGSIPVTAGDEPSRLSNQLDYDVWNQNNEQIGEVNDMVVDLGEARISYIIVGTGGFLEIGERDILVPWDQFQLQTADGTDATGDENAFIFEGDEQMLEDAPDIDINNIIPEFNEPDSGWDVDYRNYWESGVIPGTPSADETPMADMTPTAAAEATAMPDEDGDSPIALQGVVLASELLDAEITIGAGGELMEDAETMGTVTPEANEDMDTTDENQVSAASIDDVIVNIDSGEIQYIVLNSTFDDGERWIPVPLDLLRWDVSNGSYILDVDQSMLEDAPSFQDGQYPDTMMDGWDADYDSYWH